MAQNCYTQSIYLALSAWIPLRREQKLGYLRCPAVVEEMDPADPVGGARGRRGWSRRRRAGAADRGGQVGDLAMEGGRPQCEGNRWSGGRVLMAYFGWA